MGCSFCGFDIVINLKNSSFRADSILKNSSGTVTGCIMVTSIPSSFMVKRAGITITIPNPIAFNTYQLLTPVINLTVISRNITTKRVGSIV